MLTDRDIAVSVDVMRPTPAVIRDDKGLLDAVKLLAAKGVRRLPVVDNRGYVTGTTSRRALALARAPDDRVIARKAVAASRKRGSGS
jgi:predicted transcriptional regulator